MKIFVIVWVAHFLLMNMETLKSLFNPCDISKEKNSNLRTLIKTVTKAFEMQNVTYWVDYGTALGAYRYCDVIPWDYDADISYLYRDHNKLLRALEDITQNKEFVYHKELSALHYRRVYIDLFPWEKVRNWWSLKSVYNLFTDRIDSVDNYMMYRVNVRKYETPKRFVKNFFLDYFPLNFLNTRSNVKFADYEVYTLRNLSELVQWRYRRTIDRVIPSSVFCFDTFYNSSGGRNSCLNL